MGLALPSETQVQTFVRLAGFLTPLKAIYIDQVYYCLQDLRPSPLLHVSLIGECEKHLPPNGIPVHSWVACRPTVLYQLGVLYSDIAMTLTYYRVTIWLSNSIKYDIPKSGDLPPSGYQYLGLAPETPSP